MPKLPEMNFGERPRAPKASESWEIPDPDSGLDGSESYSDVDPGAEQEAASWAANAITHSLIRELDLARTEAANRISEKTGDPAGFVLMGEFKACTRFLEWVIEKVAQHGQMPA